MLTCEEIRKNSKSGSDFARGYIGYLSSLLANLDVRSIEEVLELFIHARDQGRTIFICGNGGSAATSSHFAVDLALGPPKRGNKPFKALSLAYSTPTITAIGNDEGYEEVFVRQLKNFFVAGDVVIGISASGNSPNVIRALEYANAHGGVSVGFTGFDGGEMQEVCRHCIHVETLKGEYEPVEDAHLILCHLLSSYFKYQPE